ncbi:MAG: immunoglobulin [Candidatus Limivicinus sp.]
MKLSEYEQETIILYNQAEPNANVYTHDPKLLEKLARLAEKYPQQIQPEGPNSYNVPKACVLVREPYSEERRAAARELAKASGKKPPKRGASFKTP